MLLLAGCAQGGMAAVIGVPADVPTIQDAVDVAEPGDVVLVAAGTWNETINVRGKSIVLRGAAGSLATTLDGRGLEGSVIRCVGEETAETRIEGFTITGGSGDVNAHGSDSTIGGGLLIVGSSPTIFDCVFRENRATLHGGAAYCGENANATFQDCVFQSNVGEKGGAVFNIRSNPRFSECTFIGNLADYGGGGVYNDRQCSPSFIGCHFDSNEAIYNGGAIYDYESSGSISECSFARNTAAFKGGAVYIAYRSDSVIANCRFLTQTDDVAGRRGIVSIAPMIRGACCLGGGCIVALEADCEKAGGAFSGGGSTCDETVMRCPEDIQGDLNQDGQINRTDMAVLMLLWK
jgi:predicted outer membrane repeat protein